MISGFTHHYLRDVTAETTESRRLQTILGGGYNIRGLGSLTLTFSSTDHRRKFDQKIVSVGYSKAFLKNFSFLARYQWRKEEKTINEIFFGLHYFPGKDITISNSYQNVDDTHKESVQIQKNNPLGEGFGGRVLYETEESKDTIETFGQYNAAFGTLSGRYRAVNGNETFQTIAAGSLAYVGDTIGATRPIRDSFGVVKVDELQGVRVYQSGEEIGKTNQKGKLFLPDLSSFFDNQVSINDRDIPLNYRLKNVIKYVSPPLMSGSTIPFNLQKFQAVTGKIKIKSEEKILPVEFYEINTTVDRKEVVFQTFQDGEFYLEEIPGGSYPASFDYDGTPCSFTLKVPESEDLLIDIGDLICEPAS